MNAAIGWVMGAIFAAMILESIGMAALAKGPPREFGPSWETAPPEWARVLELAAAAPQELEQALAAEGEDGRPDPWHGQLALLRDRPMVTRMVGLEILFRRHVRFREDRTNWWKLPHETRALGGDCEDWAILAFVSLAAVGVPVEDMRVHVVWSPQTGAHAVLYVQDGTDAWEFDSIAPHVTRGGKSHYQLRWSLGPDGRRTFVYLD